MSENDSVVYYDQQTSPGSFEGRLNAPGGGQPKRFRTQMSSTQLRVMKSIFHDYKTPTMAECESLGAQIGLQKRVIQVWFQNARAKEKKAKAAALKLGQVPEPDPPRPEFCEICNIRYESFSSSLQDHIFSIGHIDKLKKHIESSKDDDSTQNPPTQGALPLTVVSQLSEPSALSSEHSQLVQQLQQLQMLNQLNLQQQQQQQQQHQKDSQHDSGNIKNMDSTNNNPSDDFSLFTGAPASLAGQNQFSFYGGQTPSAAPLFSSGRP